MKTPHFRSRAEFDIPYAEADATLSIESTFFFHDNGDTECRTTLLAKNGEHFYGEGFALLNPIDKDRYNRGFGIQLSAIRALQSAADDAERYLIAANEEANVSENCAAFEDGSAPRRADDDYGDEWDIPYRESYSDHAAGLVKDCAVCASQSASRAVRAAEERNKRLEDAEAAFDRCREDLRFAGGIRVLFPLRYIRAVNAYYDARATARECRAACRNAA